MIVQKIFYQFLRFKKNFYDSVYQWEFFEVASFNTGFYGDHNYKRAPFKARALSALRDAARWEFCRVPKYDGVEKSTKFWKWHCLTKIALGSRHLTQN